MFISIEMTVEDIPTLGFIGATLVWAVQEGSTRRMYDFHVSIERRLVTNANVA